MEALFKVINEAFATKDFYIESLRGERDRLINENKELHKKIEELETERTNKVMEAIE